MNYDIKKLAEETPRSEGITTPNPIFETVTETVGTQYVKNQQGDIIAANLFDLGAGIKIRLLGCDLSSEGMSPFYVDHKTLYIPNKDLKHISGELGEKAGQAYQSNQA